jgi:putative endopeptidase
MRSSLILALALAGCPGKSTPTAAPEAKPSDPAAATVLSAMDSAADPCDDFYRYACGGWLDATEIPGDQVRWGRSFSTIRESNQAELRAILDGSTEGDGGQLGAWYGSCMDTEAMDARGAEPLAEDLAAVAAIEDVAGAFEFAGTLHRSGGAVFFDGGVYPDFKDPDLNILHMGQGGLGLPDRDYYLSEDKAKIALRSDYEANVARLLMLAGHGTDPSLAAATRVLAFETELATISQPRAELRDPEKTYNRVDREGLEKLSPSLDWASMFSAFGAPDLTALSVQSPAYFEALDALILRTDVETLRAYLGWHVVLHGAPRLSEKFRQAHFEFFRARLAGQRERKERWKECADSVNGVLGELIGQEYVARRFSGDSKPKALAMVDGIVGAFEAALPELEWMDAGTREGAIKKAKALTPKIGYPDQWRDYSSLTLGEQWFENALAGDHFEADRALAKVGNAVDRSEWFMPPAVVNAYYNPLFGEIVFPAGILQPPFFSKDFPASMNYGAIGAVIGHELSHGFDDSGRKFDDQGRMREWWAPEVATAYEERAACVQEQYDGYELRDGLSVNGKLTLGENIADVAGIKQAHAAFLATGGEPADGASIVQGLDNEQLFFVAYAQAWCSEATPQIEEMLLTTDTHSPAVFRVRGPLSNFASFADAFSCEAGSAMVREPACTVW